MPESQTLPAEQLLTVPEFAALARLHPKSVYDLIAAGKLSGVIRLGRSLRILRSVALSQVTP